MHHEATAAAAVLPSVKGIVLVGATWVLALIARMNLNETMTIASTISSLVLGVLAGYNYVLRIQDAHRERRERREREAKDTDDKG